MTTQAHDVFARAAAEGRATFGLWAAIPDRLSIETIAKAGYEWVILDVQHGGITWDSLLGAIQTLDLHRIPALVRVDSNDPAKIMRALDLGARGVVVPLVNTPEEAQAAARAALYPPRGIRSFGQVRSFYSAGGQAASDPLCLVMIETAEALGNLEAIAATSGVGGLFVGPVDLALSLGASTTEALTMSEAVLAEVDRVVAVSRKNGLIAGCPALGMDNAQALLGRGVTFVPVGSDIGLLRRSATADVSQMRSWIGIRDDG